MRIEANTTTVAGREEALRHLVSALYARPTISLAEFAPLAFAAHEDRVARTILVRASAALANPFSAVRAQDLPGPVVVVQHHRPRHAGCATQPSGRSLFPGGRRSRDFGFGWAGGCGSAGLRHAGVEH